MTLPAAGSQTCRLALPRSGAVAVFRQGGKNDGTFTVDGEGAVADPRVTIDLATGQVQPGNYVVAPFGDYSGYGLFWEDSTKPWSPIRTPSDLTRRSPVALSDAGGPSGGTAQTS
ncbi:hypothetical protein [Nonomuraea jabiensis]|uniref:Uncharacterized protein n=1 Tax=Nonomuraea jabiensis TaxID=882448 RepID=A0A7W9GAI1_9ACTN|nr:hypothetical protein [Nonomuraea jabiensis]MBB5780215.1 hypothetical protein [Nonomuraea jabiensis]